MVDTRHKSVQISDLLRHRLRSGHAIPGTRFYSNNSLARDFGVSAPTAGKILDGLCAEGLVQRVHGSGTYVTESAIQPTLQHLLMVARIELGHPSTPDTVRYNMIRGFESICTAHGRQSALINPNDADHQELTDQYLAAGVAGALVLSPYQDPGLVAVLTRLAAARVPLVYWANDDTRTLPLPAGARVAFDEQQTGRLATEHLLALGHRQVVFAGYAAPQLWQQERLAGCRAALQAAGLRLPTTAIGLFDATELRPTVLTLALSTWFARGCTAIVAANDKLAVELLLAAKAIDRRCPADYALVGVDNREQALLTGLTTIDQPGEAFARTAFAVLAERQPPTAAPPPERLVPCSLIVRRSTGVPPDPLRN